MQPATPEAYQLLHQGGLALAAAEARGVRIDTARLAAYQVEVEGKKRDTMAWMREQPEFQAQRKRYGTNTNANSREQLAGVLYGDMGHPYPGSRGAAGQYLLDEARLAAIGSPYTKAFLTWAKLDKLAGTYLAAVARECTPAGRLHCFFNLHNIITYRSSSDSINFQNIPIRNKAISRYIRSCFVPDPGYCLLEADYSSAEVRVAACYHKDTTMLAYIEDDYDMHHAMGLECYKLAPAQMDKAIRNQVKGTFVFAEFYGDYYKPVAAGLWDAADKLRLALASMEALLLLPAPQRLAQRLLVLAHGTRSSRAEGTFRRHISVTQDELARMLGVSRQTINQILQDFKDQGLIALQRGELELLDIDALRALSAAR